MTPVPFLRWWPRVDRETARADIVAGLSGAILVLPQGIAYATIAGLPPEYGLYSAMVPAIVAALFGSSWHLVSGPTATMSIVVFSTLSELATPGSTDYVQLSLALTLIAGVVMLGMGIARMGTLVNFVSNTVVVGFTAGAALLIAASQLKNVFGVRIKPGSSFVETLIEFSEHADVINPYVTGIAAVTLAAGILIRRYARRVPYMIGAMVVASVTAAIVNIVVGHERTGIATVGALSAGLPPLSLPEVSFDLLQRIGPSAIALALLGLTEAISIARAVALRSHQRIDGNQEFIGQGLSNIAGSFFSAYATSGSFTRSGLNYDAGAKTPLAAMFAAVFLAILVVFVAPLAAYLPVAAMGGILLMVAYGLIDITEMRAIVKTGKSETAVLAVTLAATLLIELQYAIYIGVMLSLMLFLNRTSRPAIYAGVPAPGQNSYHFVRRESEPECCQMKIAFIDGPIYFGAVDHVQEALQAIDEANPAHKHVLVLAPGINFVDAAGMSMLAHEAKRRRAIGGGLYFHRLKEPIVAAMTSAGVVSEIGEQNLFPMGPHMIDALYARLDSDVCLHCSARIFRQCDVALPNGEPRVAQDSAPRQRAD